MTDKYLIMGKEYKVPVFQVIKQSEANDKFFVATGLSNAPTTASTYSAIDANGWF